MQQQQTKVQTRADFQVIRFDFYQVFARSTKAAVTHETDPFLGGGGGGPDTVRVNIVREKKGGGEGREVYPAVVSFRMELAANETVEKRAKVVWRNQKMKRKEGHRFLVVVVVVTLLLSCDVIGQQGRQLGARRRA